MTVSFKPGRLSAKVSRRFLAAAIFALAVPLLFCWLADEVFEGDLKPFDDWFRLLVNQSAGPGLASFFIFISVLGSPLFLICLGSVICGMLCCLRSWIPALVIAVTLTGEIAMSYVLKTIFERARPDALADVVFQYAVPSSFSFPSGHAFGSFCFYGIVAWLLIARVRRTGLRVAIGTVAVSLVLLIGISRIYLGVHYPSDVLAGFAAGLFWIGTVAMADTYLSLKQEKN